MVRIIIWCILLTVSTVLFRKCSGTLNPCKLNILSFSFFLIILQTIIGAVLTSVGFTGHYTYRLLNNPEEYTQMGIFYSIILIILLPLISFFILKILKINPETEYNNYLRKKTEADNISMYFGLMVFASIICITFLVVMLFKIGYVPLIKLFIHNSDFNFSLERQINEDINIFGVTYIKSIMILYAIPVLSFLAFGFFIATKKRRWGMLFAVLFVASIIVKTYNFAKAPIVLYLLILMIIFIVYNGGISIKILIACGSFGVVLLVMGYQLLGSSNGYLDIYNGILGRTFFTQFGTLCMHFEAFSEYFDFLHGRSLYPTMLSILGMDPDTHIRSARVVMELYNTEDVYSGEAGVMNTVFIGEAYANWGVLGIFLGILWIGIVLTVCFVLFMKLKKNAITIAYYGIITQQLVMGLEGGFTDYLYNSTYILNFAGLFALYYLPMITEKITIILNKIKQKNN